MVNTQQHDIDPELANEILSTPMPKQKGADIESYSAHDHDRFNEQKGYDISVWDWWILPGLSFPEHDYEQEGFRPYDGPNLNILYN